jgi:hypothetical protein
MYPIHIDKASVTEKDKCILGLWVLQFLSFQDPYTPEGPYSQHFIFFITYLLAQ